MTLIERAAKMGVTMEWYHESLNNTQRIRFNFPGQQRDWMYGFRNVRRAYHVLITAFAETLKKQGKR